MILELIRYWPGTDDTAERIYVNCPAKSETAWEMAELEIKQAVHAEGIEFFNPVLLNGHSDIYRDALCCFVQSYMSEHPDTAKLAGPIEAAEGEPSAVMERVIAGIGRRRNMARVIKYFEKSGLDVNIIYDAAYGGANYFTDRLVEALKGITDGIIDQAEPEVAEAEAMAESEIANAE